MWTCSFDVHPSPLPAQLQTLEAWPGEGFGRWLGVTDPIQWVFAYMFFNSPFTWGADKPYVYQEFPKIATLKRSYLSNPQILEYSCYN